MRTLFFISGFTLPFPIFVDVSRWELIIHKIYEDGYLVSAGMPVPVGLFSSTLILGLGAIHGLRRSLPTKIWFYFGLALLYLMSFTLYASGSLTTPRLISLVLPIASSIFLALFLAAPNLVTVTLRGFLIGLFALLILHTSSALYEMVNRYQGNFFLFQSIFGFFIYQALISYSAILSILVCASFYHALITRRKRVAILMLILTVLALFLVILGQRKAFVMDVGVMVLCLSLYLSRHALFRGSLSVKSLLAAGALLSIAALTLIFSFQERDENLLESAFEQRGGAYIMFLEKLSSGSVVEVLFGFEAGWGGYSNLFIEMIVRLGFLGLSLYLFAIFCSLKLIFRMTEELREDASNRFFYGSRSPLWLFFFLSTVAANIINMNLQLPYYVINLIFIFLLFFFLQSVFHKSSTTPHERIPAAT